MHIENKLYINYMTYEDNLSQDHYEMSSVKSDIIELNIHSAKSIKIIYLTDSIILTLKIYENKT